MRVCRGPWNVTVTRRDGQQATVGPGGKARLRLGYAYFAPAEGEVENARA